MIAPNSTPDALCVVRDIHHRYGDHQALRGVDLDVASGQIVALLGPNGSGKTTLFRLLCTLLPIQRGTIHLAGIDVGADPLAARRRIGIVFQSPSLDNKLTVDENLACQAALYGVRGRDLVSRRDQLLTQFGLTDRRNDLCESLSGGLKRRVELAKGMLHHPQLLLLDEPSTGLDPAARIQFWEAIRSMADRGIAVLLTTHLLAEADRADQVAIMAAGKIIADGSPAQLRRELGQGVITIAANDADSVERVLRDELHLHPQRIRHQFRLQPASPAELMAVLVERLGDRAQSITIGRPSLEDVFIAKTGQEFADPQS